MAAPVEFDAILARENPTLVRNRHHLHETMIRTRSGRRPPPQRACARGTGGGDSPAGVVDQFQNG